MARRKCPHENPDRYKSGECNLCAKARARERRNTPEYKARAAAYASKPEYKARVAAYASKPEAKARRRALASKPGAKARAREYQRERDRKPERMAKKREYASKPEYKAKAADRQRKNRARIRATRYGIDDPAAIERLFYAQDGHCALCPATTSGSSRATGLFVDHAHHPDDRKCKKFGRVRGLLCHTCNIHVGTAEARPHLATPLVRMYLNPPPGGIETLIMWYRLGGPAGMPGV